MGYSGRVHFDSALVDVLVNVREDALAIEEEFRDAVAPDARKEATAA